VSFKQKQTEEEGEILFCQTDRLHVEKAWQMIRSEYCSCPLYPTPSSWHQITNNAKYKSTEYRSRVPMTTAHVTLELFDNTTNGNLIKHQYLLYLHHVVHKSTGNTTHNVTSY